MGVHPGPLTLRELVWMAEAHRKEAWQHTSTIIATLANIHRDPKKKPKPFTPADFQPIQEKRTDAQPMKSNIRALQSVFVKPRS